MKKVLLLLAGVALLDLLALAALMVLCWNPMRKVVSDVFVARGHALGSQRKDAEALAQYDIALWIDPDNVHAHVVRADCRAYLNKLDGAFQDADQAIALDPTNGAAYLSRGWVRELRKDWPGAHADYDLAIQYDPTVPSYYSHRAYVREHEHQTDAALVDINKAMSLDPGWHFFYHLRAWMKSEKDDLAGALQDENAAIQYAPTHPDYFLARSDLHLKMGDVSNALADARQALVLDPRSADGFYHEALARRSGGDATGAIALLNQALEINPRFSGALFDRAMTHYMMGDLNDARSDLRSCRGSTAMRIRTQLWLWVVDVESGNKADADRNLDRYMTDARHQTGTVWPGPVGDLLLNRTTGADIAAGSVLAKTGEDRRDQLCQLWFFAGKAALLKGDKAGAKSALQAAVDTKADDLFEYSEAGRELAGL